MNRHFLSALVALGSLLGTPTAEAEPSARSGTESEHRYTGMRLADALLSLRERGLQIVFSDQLVRPSFRVTSEPVGTEPLIVLEEMLSEFTLTATQGPNGLWVVVANGSTETAQPALHGVVWSATSLSVVAGATIWIPETRREAVSGLDGRFKLSPPSAEPVTVLVHRPGFLPGVLENVKAQRSLSRPLVFFLEPAPVIQDELVVTTSQISILDTAATSGLALSKEEIGALPQLGDDLFRAMSLFPGTAANDVSAQFRIRGGRRDEVRLVLDGHELFNPFHMQEFDNALSLIAPALLERADLSTGGFGASHGDRMGGVLDLTTLTATGASEFHLGIGIANAQAGGSGTFARTRGDWLYNFRRGAIDLIGRLLDEEDPEYWDTFAKIRYRATPRQSFRLNSLVSEDRLSFQEIDGEDAKDIQTRHTSLYAWLTHQALVSRRLLTEGSAAVSRVRRDRQGSEFEELAQLQVNDQRELRVFDLRMSGSFQASPRHSLDLGLEHRRSDNDYDYLLETTFEDPLAAVTDSLEDGSRRLDERLVDRHSSLYLTDRVVLRDRVTLQLGLRYDRTERTDESYLSPRANLSWRVGSNNGIVRVSWGRFHQSQRVYELLVEDEAPASLPAERSDQWVVGYERQIGSSSSSAQKPVTARIEAYWREVGNPRPRYENLYEPINTFPEAEPDRIRIAPQSSRAHGVELFVRGRTNRFGWWANYTYSRTEDEIGDRRVVRAIDQTHAFNLDLDYPLGEHWRINLAWRLHTGWPTTPLSLEEVFEDEEAKFEVRLGRLNSERLNTYHRFDVRAGRSWQLAWGEVFVFADVQNLYDRRNIAGFDIEVDDEEGTIERGIENWAGILPSAGIRVTF